MWISHIKRMFLILVTVTVVLCILRWRHTVVLHVQETFNVLQTNSKPPHIIFIVADDLGWNDVGWHNPTMYTPNLDKMAMKGVRLNSSYVQPLCSPSRNCFMTGYYPYHTELQHDAIHTTHPIFLPAYFTTLPQKLKELGYTTHMVGKWHLRFCNWRYTPTERGFDSFMGFYSASEDHYTHKNGGLGYDFRWNTSVYHPPTGDYSAIIADHAIRVIKAVDPKQELLYLYLPFQAVHKPLQVHERYMNLPPYQHIQHIDRLTYCGMVSALDEAVGNITSVLKERGFLDNALIVFTTDNGGATFIAGNNLPLRGAKHTLWEGGTKGAGFVYSETLLRKTGYLNTEGFQRKVTKNGYQFKLCVSPSKTAICTYIPENFYHLATFLPNLKPQLDFIKLLEPIKDDRMIHAVDWFPTLLSVAGGHPDSSMDGKNQWPTISQSKPSARTEFVYNIDEILNNSAIRMGKYKLIQGSPGSYNDWAPVQTFILKEHAKMKQKSGPQDFPPYQLFDIEDDPTEQFNIADKYPDVLDEMKDRLKQYRKSLVPANDPGPDPKSDPKNFGGNWSPGWCA